MSVAPEHRPAFGACATGPDSHAGRWSRRSLLGGSPALALSVATLGCRSKGGQTPFAIQLNWVPEPEFGGFYEAQRLGLLEGIELRAGSPGLPTAQLVASGKVDMGIVTADELLRLRSQSADLVGVYASFLKSPRGLVVHQGSPFQSLSELWQSSSTVGIEPGQAYVAWLDQRYGGRRLKRVPRPASLASFMEDPNFAQGIYVFAEGAELARRKVPVRIFPVAGSGYNPYEVLLATRASTLKSSAKRMAKIIEALREGWSSYLRDPAPSNARMAKLNPAMSAQTMMQAAVLLKDYVQAKPGDALGAMTLARWEELAGQMQGLGLLDKKVDAKACFWSP